MEQINFFRYLVNDPKYQAKLAKEQRQKEIVIDTAGSNLESPWPINDHSTSKVNTIINGDSQQSINSTQTIPPIKNSNVNLDDISILDREQLLLNRITAGYCK